MRDTDEGLTALTADATPSLDVVFQLLSNNRRRYALYHLNDQSDGVTTVETLTESVISFERMATITDGAPGATVRPLSDGDCEDGPTEYHERVRMDLTHAHLPKLEDAGLIEHDSRSEMVRYWGQPSLKELLEHARHKELE